MVQPAVESSIRSYLFGPSGPHSSVNEGKEPAEGRGSGWKERTEGLKSGCFTVRENKHLTCDSPRLPQERRREVGSSSTVARWKDTNHGNKSPGKSLKGQTE